MAIKVLDTALRSDFAFRNILWIYSGRRGVHCWVCDQSARTLPNETRAAIVEYLSVQTGSQENSSKKLRNPFSKPCHPMIRRSYELLEPYFLKYIIDETGQGLLATKDRYVKILATIPNETVRLNLFDEWKNINEMTSTQRWKSLKEATSPPQVNKINSNKKSKVDYSELESWRMELIFTHCYPRLDAEVSKSQNHLLKSPFCVHPKTGRVCVPIDPTIADSFDPFAVPTLRVLCEEVAILFLK
jgi:DNA primase small subunit